MPTIFSALQSMWSRCCQSANHPNRPRQQLLCQLFFLPRNLFGQDDAEVRTTTTLTSKPPRVANCSCQLPRQTFFTNYTLSSTGGFFWMADGGRIHPAERAASTVRGAQSACQMYFTSHTLTGNARCSLLASELRRDPLRSLRRFFSQS